MILYNQQRQEVGTLRQDDRGLWVLHLRVKPLQVKAYTHRDRERLEQMFYRRHPQGVIQEENALPENYEALTD